MTTVERIASVMKAKIGEAFNAKPIPRSPSEWGDWSATGGTLDLEEVARAVLEAMYEPDTQMLRGLLEHRGYDPDADEGTLDRLGQLDLAMMGTYVSAYKAMIKAAL